MSKYNVVMEMSNSTVVTEYKPVQKRSDSYQSEATLEKEFIKMLEEQGYDYLQIHDSNTLINNLRKQLELLNKYNFTDSEWERFFILLLSLSSIIIMILSCSKGISHITLFSFL